MPGGVALAGRGGCYSRGTCCPSGVVALVFSPVVCFARRGVGFGPHGRVVVFSGDVVQ